MARTRGADHPASRNRDVLRHGSAQVAITPGGGEMLTAPAAFFSQRSYALQQLFGYAVSHAFARQGGAIVHGAAFALDHRAVLTLGLSRAGKSTLSALALRAGARVVSDDTLLVGQDQDGHTRVEALREEMYLREPTQTLLPAALQAGLQPTTISGEHRWILDRSMAASFTRSIRPSLVLSTKVDRRLAVTRIQPMAKTDVLAELIRAASPLFLSPRYPVERAALLPVLMSLALRAPGFRVRLGRDLFAAPDATFQRLLDATEDKGVFDGGK
ncbi:MAG: hypothetical protein WAV07_00025 [Candidatus Contendobacter sp.]